MDSFMESSDSFDNITVTLVPDERFRTVALDLQVLANGLLAFGDNGSVARARATTSLNNTAQVSCAISRSRLLEKVE
jgi:hypothetical protein